MVKPAVLALADGSLFWGQAIGKLGRTTAEVVFNTAMSGYEEIMTDASYAEQIITFTSPHIGNTGINTFDYEAAHVWAKGIIVREAALVSSNWRSEQSFNAWLEQLGIIGIAGIDTRYLTQLLRQQGSLAGCIMSEAIDVEQAIYSARELQSMEGRDLTTLVTTTQPYSWEEGSYQTLSQVRKNKPHIVVYDFGVKFAILRQLVDRGCKVTVVPAHYTSQQVLALQPNGIVLSNGPGDPAACSSIIATIQQLLSVNLPILGICLGHQLLALATGGKTFKMKFGHHGANHPVKDLLTGQVYITSQNHNFAVDETTLPACWQITQRSLFDNTIQGLKHRDKPIITAQGHPEGNAGPIDAAVMFDQFISFLPG